MMLEIHGAGFHNKGAELMLRTTVSELSSRFPELSLAIDPTYGSFKSRNELGLKQIFPVRGHVGTYHYSVNLYKQKLFSNLYFKKIVKKISGCPMSLYGAVTLSEMDALVDISGFAFTEQWGLKPTLDFAKLTSYYKSKNKPIILLPQAFGPFKCDEIRLAFKKIIDNSTLIYARDKVSYEHIMDISPDAENTFIAPDITFSYPQVRLTYESPNLNYICLIPNTRMLDQGHDQWGKKYLLFLRNVIQIALDHNVSVYVVTHDTSGRDWEISKQISQGFNKEKVSLSLEENPLKLKELMSKSLFVVGSRYHSLVSALSKSIPAIAMGWSHKYEMLFHDFGVDEFIISPDKTPEYLSNCINELFDLSVNLSYRGKINEKSKEIQMENQEMWMNVSNAFLSRDI